MRNNEYKLNELNDYLNKKVKKNDNKGKYYYNEYNNKIDDNKENKNKNNKIYKTEINSPNYNIKKNKDKNINAPKNKINNIKNLLNKGKSPITLNNNIKKKNIKKKREIEYENENNESQYGNPIKFNDYTFSQKSDNTNTNNTKYNFKNKIINFGYNNQSPSNLRNLVEEQNENYKKRIGKIVNQGKVNSYSPKLKYKNKYDFSGNKNKKKKMIKSFQNKSYRKEIGKNIFSDNKISLEFKTFTVDNNLKSDYNFNYLGIKNKKYYNQNTKFEYNKNNSIIKDIEFKNNFNFLLEKSEKNYYFNSNELNKKYENHFYNNDIRLNTLNINENINLKPLYNIEERTIPINTNKSFEFIMPPNDLTDIYKKNLIFHKLINQD